MKARYIIDYALDFVCILCILVVVIPLVYTSLCAFKTETEIISYPQTILPENPTFDNFASISTYIDLPRCMLNSLIVAGSVTISQVLLGSLAGYAFAKFRFRGKETIFMLMLSKMMIPDVLLIIPWFQIMITLHLIDNIAAVILPSLAGMWTIFFMRQYIISIPDDLINSGRIDGASEFRIFFQIVFPLIMPAIVTAAINNFLIAWSYFLWPIMVLSSRENILLQMGVRIVAGSGRSEYLPHPGRLAAISLIYTIPTLVLYILFAKRFVRSIALTGLKG